MVGDPFMNMKMKVVIFVGYSLACRPRCQEILLSLSGQGLSLLEMPPGAEGVGMALGVGERGVWSAFDDARLALRDAVWGASRAGSLLGDP
ncbi:hypothetical protein WMF45_32700 [Sorangium sp. So ce448]|uniref:hypothetical protein n=1 Tax=Sorangium sp. So ce448 TaxID=3133314 RepID=UPI003F5E706C